MKTSNNTVIPNLKDYYTLDEAGKIIGKSKESISLCMRWYNRTKQEIPEELKIFPEFIRGRNGKSLMVKKKDLENLEKFFFIKNNKYRGIMTDWLALYGFSNKNKFKNLSKKEIDKLKETI